MNLEQEPMTEINKESEWFNQEALLKRVRENGARAYVESLPNLAEAFRGDERELCCMDEGTPVGTFRSAGSGILTEGAEREKFLAALKAAGIEGVTSHEGCGAAGLFRKKHNLENKTADEVAIEEAKKIAAELGVPYRGHITELKRPKEFHNARVVYYDATGRFNPSKIKELPPGFVVSRRYMTPEQATEELKIAASIAFGDHGFGDKFNPDSPLLIIPIADLDFDVTETNLINEISGALANGTDKERIKIDAFTKPK